MRLRNKPALAAMSSILILYSGGRRSTQGRAASNCAATEQSKPSRPSAETNWNPIGNPAVDGFAGMLIPGQPVMLTNAVNIACPLGPTSLPAIICGKAFSAGQGNAAADGVMIRS